MSTTPYHVRIRANWDSSGALVQFFSRFDTFVLTHEGQGYCKIQKRWINSHYHCYVLYPIVGGSVKKTTESLREMFRLNFPQFTGNRAYSCRPQKNENNLSYVIKDIYLKPQNLIAFKGLSKEYLYHEVPKWKPKQQHYKDQLRLYWNDYKQPLNCHNIDTNFSTFCSAVSTFCKANKKYLPKRLYIQYAYEWGVVNTIQYNNMLHLDIY